MIIVTVNTENIIRSLTKLQAEFQRTSTNAVAEASAELVNGIVSKTLAPPPKGPPPKYYVRTWRLVHGWGPAARQFNIAIPPLTPFAATVEDEGSSLFREGEYETTFRATNRVPYAVEVEYEGTWGPGKVMRGGYNIVGSSVDEMRNEGKLPKYAREAWQLARDSV